MKSMEEMIKAAQAAAETIQKQMNEAQAKLDQLTVEGVAGGGLVKIRASAKGRVTRFHTNMPFSCTLRSESLGPVLEKPTMGGM